MADNFKDLTVRRAILAASAALVIIALVVVVKAFANHELGDKSPKGKQYQAVFLTNGQVYFGKLSGVGSKTYVLKNVYYIQSNPQGSATASPSPQLSLVQLGNEIHGPESEMQILSDQVLFWENLKNDSKVVNAINGKK